MMLLESKESVLVIGLDQVDGEFTFISDTTKEETSWLTTRFLVSHVFIFERPIEIRQDLLIIHLVTMFINEFINQVDEKGVLEDKDGGVHQNSID